MARSLRPLCAGVCRFLLVATMALVLLTGATFIFATVIAAVRHGSWDQPLSLITGLCCGLIAGLFVAIFHLRHETQKMDIAQREPFLSEATAILLSMGYASSSPEPNEWIFRPHFQAVLFGGCIHLSITKQCARLSGPKVSLELFRKRYRLEHHVNRVQKVLHDHRKTDNLLKRVELRLRLRPEQFEAARMHVVAPLLKDGNVICEWNLLCQSEQGIRENVVEMQIRDWLEQQEIPCEIHKNLVQFAEVVSAGAELEALST